MHRRLLAISLLALTLLSTPLAARADDPKTVVNDRAARQMLLGRHMLSLQWISWDYFGAATVTEKAGTLYLKGEQRQKGGTDFLEVDGRITRVDATEFAFVGRIVMQISHINGGQQCTRDGEFTFAIKGNRKYWRLQQMDNPCDTATDYVDVYFRRR